MASWMQDPLPEEFGRYHIIKVLGQGGMGAVYLARDTQLEREVALKVPHIDAQRPNLLDRFEQEARAAARVHHPNICPIYDVGEIDGKRYLTMAFIDGMPLNRVLRKVRRLTPRQAAHLVRKLAIAVHEAHQAGVVHRDLKPANIMVDRRGEPVIMDFGLARRYQSDDVHLTRDGATIGTPVYMAPEQCRRARQTLGPSCDIYTLGVILYEVLAGRPPFTGENSMEVLSKVLVDEAPPLSAHRSDIDPELERICRKAMAKNVEARYATAGALAVDLKNYLKNQATTTSGAAALVAIPLDEPDRDTEVTEVEAAGTRSTKVGGPATSRDGQADRRQTPPRARRRLPIWLAVAGVVALGALLVILPVTGYVIYRVTDYGTCRIELTDPDAPVTVRVDGADVDAKAAEGLRLPPGAHRLEVLGQDYEPVRMPFTVQRGDNPPLVVPLELKFANITVALSDPGAAVDIRIDGQPGYRHGQVLRLTPRQPHVVEVKGGRDYQDVRQPFTVEPGVSLTMTVHLKKRVRPGGP